MVFLVAAATTWTVCSTWVAVRFQTGGRVQGLGAVASASRDFVAGFLVGLPSSQNRSIPHLLFQTWKDRQCVPQKVLVQAQTLASSYRHIILDDLDSISFLRAHYAPAVLERYLAFKSGAHKADMLRYCLLYKYGGVYLDIETVLVQPLENVFTDREKAYSVLSYYNGTIMQGVLAAPPHLDLFLYLILAMVNTPQLEVRGQYRVFTTHFHQALADLAVSESLVVGVNRMREGPPWVLLQEHCTRRFLKQNAPNCGGEWDKGGSCCWILSQDARAIQFKTRFPDFPSGVSWNEPVKFLHGRR